MAAPAEEYQAIHAIADRLAPALRRAFLAAVQQLRRRISLAALARALERGQLTPEIERALETWTPALRNAVAVANQVLARAGAEAATQLSSRLTLTTSFDLTNPFAVEAAQTRTAFLVREIVQQQRLAIQQVITRAIVDGVPPRQAAGLIREVVGLTSQQMHAVMNHQSALIVEGLSVEKAEQSAERYAAPAAAALGP